MPEVTPELLGGTLNGIQTLYEALAEAANADGVELCLDSWHNPASGATYVCRLKKEHEGKYHADVFVASIDKTELLDPSETKRHFGSISVWEADDAGTS